MNFETKIRKGNGITCDYVVYVIEDGEEFKIGQISKVKEGAHVMNGAISVGRTAAKGFYATATRSLESDYCGANKGWNRTRADAVASLVREYNAKINAELNRNN